MGKKVVLVTGSNRGIGKACIEEFAKAGLDVVINYCHRKNEAYALKKAIETNYDVNVINVMLADKLHNLISNYDNFLKYGDKLWKNTGGTKDENRYMYREIYNIAKKKNANEGLLKRYKEIVTLYFGELEDE